VPDWPLPAALPALAEPYGEGAAGVGPVLAAGDAAKSPASPEDRGSTPVGAAAACGWAGRATTTEGVMMLAEDEGGCTATVVPLLSAWYVGCR
jgi:hypothetical protein